MAIYLKEVLAMTKHTEILLPSDTIVDLSKPFTGDNTIEITDVAKLLSRTQRWGKAVKHAINVAEHSVMVANLLEGQNKDTQLYGLLHDCEEALTGDVPSGVKQHLFYRTEDNALESLNILRERIIDSVLYFEGKHSLCINSIEPDEEVNLRAVDMADELAFLIEIEHLAYTANFSSKLYNKAQKLRDKYITDNKNIPLLIAHLGFGAISLNHITSALHHTYKNTKKYHKKSKNSFLIKFYHLIAALPSKEQL